MSLGFGLLIEINKQFEYKFLAAVRKTINTENHSYFVMRYSRFFIIIYSTITVTTKNVTKNLPLIKLKNIFYEAAESLQS